MNLGQLILAYREKHGLTLRKLARMIGVPFGVLYRLEKGKGIRDRDCAKVICWTLTE